MNTLADNLQGIFNDAGEAVGLLAPRIMDSGVLEVPGRHKKKLDPYIPYSLSNLGFQSLANFFLARNANWHKRWIAFEL